MLRLRPGVYAEMIGHAYDGLPDEACGLLGGHVFAAGPAGIAHVEAFVGCRNADASSRTYAIGPDGWRSADEVFGPRGLDVVGVMHSHTHTTAYPSPTDVAKADNPLLTGWHYIIVSLGDEAPVLRSYLIEGNMITEEAVEQAGR